MYSFSLCDLTSHLQLNKFGVIPALSDKLLMRTLLGYLTVLKDYDIIRILGSGYTLGNDYLRAFKIKLF